MTNFRQLLRFVLLSSMALASASWAQDSEISVNGILNIMIPSKMRGLPMDNPHVDFKIDIGADGTVFDAMPVNATHRDLLPAAHEAIQNVTFNPAQKNGQPIRSRAQVRVFFYDPDQRAWKMGSRQLPYGGNPSDAARNRMYAASAASYTYGISTREQLDTPLTQLQSKRRVYTSRGKDETRGECLVEFYVGPDGRARFPIALESDNDDVALSAALTLLETRFSPPRRNGHPTYVKIQQRFRYD